MLILTQKTNSSRKEKNFKIKTKCGLDKKLIIFWSNFAETGQHLPRIAPILNAVDKFGNPSQNKHEKGFKKSASSLYDTDIF